MQVPGGTLRYGGEATTEHGTGLKLAALLDYDFGNRWRIDAGAFWATVEVKKLSYANITVPAPSSGVSERVPVPVNGRFAALSAAVIRFALRAFFAGAGPGTDVAIRVRLEPLDDVSLVGQAAAAEEVDRKRICRVAGYRDRCRHGAASIVPVVGNGWDALPWTPARRPASRQDLPLRGAMARL